MEKSLVEYIFAIICGKDQFGKRRIETLRNFRGLREIVQAGILTTLEISSQLYLDKVRELKVYPGRYVP